MSFEFYPYTSTTNIWHGAVERITLRSCCFVRKVEFQTMFTSIPIALPKPTGSANDVPITHTNSLNPASTDTDATPGHSPQEALTHHPWTHNAGHQEFLKPYSDYAHVTLQALKNFLPLIGSCLHI